ncbi:CARDB domain-containing protein [Paenibacillus sp. UNC451MF]|uniref:CARDB domain-containing protein n=1 Tax=Paenibacillus sp. UNC451MF TaxID=1449063 RepID=UPI000491B087|nr:CARDB domain-containing protein [Paenibacillus sp. UNC451MF]
MKSKLLNSLLAISILTPSFSFLSTPAGAIPSKEVPLPVYYVPDEVLFNLGTKYFGSNKSSITVSDVIITPTGTDPISRVELRDSEDNVLQTLVNTSENTYKVPNPVTPLSNNIALESSKKVAILQGTFEWFRDPNKKVWIYDYDDPAVDDGITKRYYKSDDKIYDRPPSSFCKLHVGFPTDSLPSYPSGYEDTAQCNEATDYRQGILDISGVMMKVKEDTKITISPAEVASLNFDNQTFEFLPDGNLGQDNIKGITQGKINPKTLTYRFEYTAVYDVEPDRVDTSSPSWVFTWLNRWDIALKGEVYRYPQMKIVYVTTPPTEKTNLSFPSITAPKCVAAGEDNTYAYKLMNSGPAVSTAFKVKISTDWGEIITHTFPGIGRETKDGSFTHKFTSTGLKTITFYADSDNALELDPASERTKTLTVDVQSSCSGGPPEEGGGCSLGAGCPGVLTGKLTVRDKEIEWKDDNEFDVILDVPPNSCKPTQGRFKAIQGDNEYVYGWTSTISSSNSDSTYFRFKSNQYPANMQAGTVKVLYYVEDTCGRTSLIGPDDFKIIKISGVPTVEVSWYAQDNLKITEAIQDDIVYVKVKATDTKNEKITFSWDFTKSTPWLSSLPSLYGWKSPLDKESYTGIKATTKGSHNVCVTAINESGATATACAYLDVLGPEPKAKITVGGWPKEERRIELSGSRSYSPRNLPLTYRWTIEPVAGQTEGTMSDITYIAPLSGELKDFKTSKKGKYLVTLVVTDTMGLSDDDSEIVDVAPDIPPVANLTGNQIAGRQLPDRGLAPFVLLGYGASLDADIISKRYWTLIYDSNNDGVFNEPITAEIDEDALVQGWEYPYIIGYDQLIIIKTGEHIVTVKGPHVGKYRFGLKVIESPGQPTDLIH